MFYLKHYCVDEPDSPSEDNVYEVIALEVDGKWKPYWDKDEALPIEVTHDTADVEFDTPEEALQYARYRVDGYFSEERGHN